jgi:hypothetical protein
MIANGNEPLRKLLLSFLTQNMEMIQGDFIRLRPKERIRFYRDFMKFGLPMLRAINTGIDFSRMSEEQLDTIIDELRKSIMENEAS